MIKPLVPDKDDAVKELIQTSFERYDRIREGIVSCCGKHQLLPIMVYKLANELDIISMTEYQNIVIEYSVKLINNKEYSKTIDFDKWEKIYDNADDKIKNCWLDIIKILKKEKVKVMELSRVSAELRTSAMESFIGVLGQFVKTQKTEVSNE